LRLHPTRGVIWANRGGLTPRDRSLYRDEITTPAFRPEAEGYLTIPDKPSLGIEINREALKRDGV
jgi:L-alanine-DL-glutamate epimerase-like enolase superfamily enzyme